MYLIQLMGVSKSENIRYFCELVSEILQVPITLYNRDGDPVFEFIRLQSPSPAPYDKGLLLKTPGQAEGTQGFPLFITTPYQEVYFTMDVVREKEFLGTLVVGPALQEEMSQDALQALCRELDISARKKSELISYYEALPVTDRNKLVSASLLLHYLLYGRKLDSAEIIEKNGLLGKAAGKLDSTIDAELIKSRRHATYHHTPDYEKYILQYVKEGNRQKLLDHLSKPSGGETGRLAKNPLRSQKNLFICSATLISRAAIEGGLSSELAFTISDSYIQRVEEMTDVDEVRSLQFKMLCDFTDRVHRVKEHNYSKTILRCQNYIFQHLYEDMSMARLAELSGISANYLSELFRKEVGIPVSEYIQRERIEEAKKLLVLTDTSIMDICVSMNFSDQSYFTKVFRRFTGVTPKQYRAMNGL